MSRTKQRMQVAVVTSTKSTMDRNGAKGPGTAASERVRVHHFVYLITGALTVLSFGAAAVAMTSAALRPIATGLGVATAAHVGGFLIALILFVNVDESLRGMRTALIGALSGTSLVKAESIARFAGAQFALLGDSQNGATAALFFIGVGAGLLGIVGGFAAVRLGLEVEIAEEQKKVAVFEREDDEASGEAAAKMRPVPVAGTPDDHGGGALPDPSEPTPKPTS